MSSSNFDSPLPPYNASDPTATFVGASCLELMMIELVPMAYRVTGELHGIALQGERSFLDQDGEGGVGGGGGGGMSGGDLEKMDEEEERDAVFFRLEGLGYRVGQGLLERFSKDRPRFTDTLDIIKFLCKDLWQLVFRKQIDNLKTNHRGVYVLTDNSFRPFARMSTEPGGNAVAKAQPYLYFPCGVIRGALSSMGINATVQADTTELPGATFQIKSITTK